MGTIITNFQSEVSLPVFNDKLNSEVIEGTIYRLEGVSYHQSQMRQVGISGEIYQVQC